MLSFIVNFPSFVIRSIGLAEVPLAGKLRVPLPIISNVPLLYIFDVCVAFTKLLFKSIFIFLSFDISTVSYKFIGIKTFIVLSSLSGQSVNASLIV